MAQDSEIKVDLDKIAADWYREMLHRDAVKYARTYDRASRHHPRLGVYAALDESRKFSGD